MVPLEKLELIRQRFQFLEAKMNDGLAGEDIARLAKEYSDLRPVIEQIEEYLRVLRDIEEAQAMLDDADMRALAEEELPLLRARLPEIEKDLQIALLPKDAADARPAILEIRPVLAVKRLRYLPETFCGCISVMQKHPAGILRLSKNSKPNWVVSRKWSLM